MIGEHTQTHLHTPTCKDPVVGTPAATRQSEDTFDHQIDVGICKRAEILTGHSTYFDMVTSQPVDLEAGAISWAARSKVC